MTRKITPQKVRGNDVEIRRNLVFDVSTYYRRRNEFDSTWCVRWVCILLEEIQLVMQRNTVSYTKQVFLLSLGTQVLRYSCQLARTGVAELINFYLS